jgi:hypothetical protein
MENTTNGVLAAMSNIRVALAQTPDGVCADYLRAAYSALESTHATESRYAWALKQYADRTNWMHDSEGAPVWIGPGENGIDLAQDVLKAVS